MLSRDGAGVTTVRDCNRAGAWNDCGAGDDSDGACSLVCDGGGATTSLLLILVLEVEEERVTEEEIPEEGEGVSRVSSSSGNKREDC